jgi:hypothetical protein
MKAMSRFMVADFFKNTSTGEALVHPKMLSSFLGAAKGGADANQARVSSLQALSLYWAQLGNGRLSEPSAVASTSKFRLPQAAFSLHRR